MIDKLNIILIAILLSAVFLFEGLGLPYGRNVSYYLILVTPFALYLREFISKKNIKYPQRITSLFLIFFLFSIISTAFSVNIQKSFEQLLLFLAVFLMFIYVYNYKKRVEGLITPLIFSLSVVFSLYSILIPLLTSQGSVSLIPTHGYQFVYSVFGSHNHLGDFLLLPITISFCFLFVNKKRLLNLLFLAFSFPYFLFSYSRSSYLALIAVLVILFVYLLRKKKIVFFGTLQLFTVGAVFTLLIFFFATASIARDIPFLRPINIALSQSHLLLDKEFFSKRNEYIDQSLRSIAEKPLFGVGPGNFYYASVKYLHVKDQWTEASHNVFLDMVVENGIISGIIFLIVIGLILKNATKVLPKENTFLFFLFLALLLNFQTDYTYKIHSFFLLFFVIGALLYSENRHIHIRSALFAPAVLFLIVIFMLGSIIGVKQKNYQLANSLYPLNNEVYEPLIDLELQRGDGRKALQSASVYGLLFSGDSSVLSFIGGIYENQNNWKKALEYYTKAYDNDKFVEFSVIEKIYRLKEQYEGKESAKRFIDRFFSRFSGVQEKEQVDYNYRVSIMKFCQKVYNLHCPYDL